MSEFLSAFLWMIESFLRMIEPFLWVVVVVGVLIIGLSLLVTAGRLLWEWCRRVRFHD